MKKQYISILRTNMSNLKFRLKKIDETKSYLLDEIKHNELMSEKHKKTCKYLNYTGHLLILVSRVTGCVPVDMTTSAVIIKICAITTGIKKHKSIIKKKKKKKHDKISSLEKTKLNTIEVFISKALIDSYISDNKFFSVNNVL